MDGISTGTIRKGVTSSASTMLLRLLLLCRTSFLDARPERSRHENLVQNR